MNERIEEIKIEIERLEAVVNLDSEEFAQLKALKEELKKLEAEVEAELAKKELAVRPLLRRDIQVVQTLVKDYPGFNDISEGDRLDRIVLVLTNVCGFGGVLVSTIEAALEMASYKLNINIEEHFRSAMWTNREGETRRRYVNNFGAAYKLEPGLTLKLISEGNQSSQEEPIRKSVSVKKAIQPEVRQSSPEEISKQGTRSASKPKHVSIKEEPKPIAPKVNSGSSAEASTESKKGITSKLFSFFKK